MSKLTATDLTKSDIFVPYGPPRNEEPATYGTTTPEQLAETLEKYRERQKKIIAPYQVELVQMLKENGIKTLYTEREKNE